MSTNNDRSHSVRPPSNRRGWPTEVHTSVSLPLARRASTRAVHTLSPNIMVRFGGVPMANEAFQSEDPALERTFRGHKDSVTACAFNPNMKQLITASLDNSLMMWNFNPSMRAYRFQGHKVRDAPGGGK